MLFDSAGSLNRSPAVDSAGEVTRLLRDLDTDTGPASSRLFDLVYSELRRMAAARMAAEAPGHTLQATALVHEAWLRMVGEGTPRFANRAHFFFVAARAMRRILIESARRKHALKRGGAPEREELQDIHLVHPGTPEELVAVHEALGQLEAVDPISARLVDLRYFVGLSMEDSAEVLGISLRSTERAWTYARAWLKRQLGGGNPG
ncbi:MAG: ECF-type sigma factor [Limisphaerales bacterium]